MRRAAPSGPTLTARRAQSTSICAAGGRVDEPGTWHRPADDFDVLGVDLPWAWAARRAQHRFQRFPGQHSAAQHVRPRPTGGAPRPTRSATGSSARRATTWRPTPRGGLALQPRQHPMRLGGQLARQCLELIAELHQFGRGEQVESGRPTVVGGAQRGQRASSRTAVPDITRTYVRPPTKNTRVESPFMRANWLIRCLIENARMRRAYLRDRRRPRRP